jgi:membrane-associated phospholipid phosphatase
LKPASDEGSGAPAGRTSWLDEADRLDIAAYAAIAQTPTPGLDRWMAKLSHAADYSRLSIAAAGLLAIAGGSRGRRAALNGLGSVAVTATLVNLLAKPLGRRQRPERMAHEVPAARHIPMPISSSFPSGHSAAAFAFATGVGREWPAAAMPLRGLAALVAYSRVHTGVHYPGDTIVGSLMGAAIGQAASAVLAERIRI